MTTFVLIIVLFIHIIPLTEKLAFTGVQSLAIDLYSCQGITSFVLKYECAFQGVQWRP